MLGGIAGVGFMADFLSRPVLVGYMNGVALLIIVGQLGRLFGIPIQSQSFIDRLVELVQDRQQSNLASLLLGLSVMALILVLRRLAPKVPGNLVAVVLATLSVALTGLQERGVAVVGAIPPGLPALGLPRIAPGDVGDLLVGAAGLSLVTFCDATLIARSFARRNGYAVDANQELVGLGTANLAAGLSGAFAIGSSASRTAVNERSGGRTQMAGLVAAAGLVVVLLFLTGPLALFPTPALAGVVIASAIGLIDATAFGSLYRLQRTEAAIAVATLLGVLIFDILPGILLAVGLTIVVVLRRVARPHDAVLGLRPGDEGTAETDRMEGLETFPGLLVYRFDAPLFFANADYFESRVQDLIDEASRGGNPVEWVILDAEGTNTIDLTAAEMLERLLEHLQEQEITVVVARAKWPVRELLARTGLEQRIGETHFFPTVRAGVRAFRSRVTPA